MGLFIFNFKRFRTAVALGVLLCGAVVIAVLNLVIFLRSDGVRKAAALRNEFWQKKIQPDRRYNMVITGDSRAYRGVAPHVLKRELGIEVFNCGFSSGGHNRTVFRHLEKILYKQKDVPRAVLFVFSPLSLSESSRTNEHFHFLLQEGQGASWEKYVVEMLFQVEIRKRFKRLGKNKKSPGTEVMHEEGWIEGFRKKDKKLFEKGMELYDKKYVNNTFSPRSLKEVTMQTALWKKENIAVFGFWVPSCPEMEAFEIARSGCDMNKVKEEFSKAGGIWLDVNDRLNYNAYDASHLSSAEALRLTEDIAVQIKRKFLK